MSRNVHEVASVLVPDPTVAVIAAGQPLSALAAGQMGVFSLKTNLSIDGTVPAQGREFYIALAEANCAGGIGNIKKSAGMAIQRQNIAYYTVRGYTPREEQVHEITGVIPAYDSEYVVKLQFNTAQQYVNYGFQGANKSYSIRTGCCPAGTANCNDGDKSQFAQLLAKEINEDEEGLVTAVLYPNVDNSTIGGAVNAANEIDPTDDAAIAAYLAANPANHLNVRIYTVLTTMAAFCGIPEKHFSPQGVSLNIVGRCGFDCNGTFSKIRSGTYEQMSGQDFAWLDYFNKGWDGSFLGPYRQTASGITLNNSVVGNNCNGCCPAMYHTIQLGYDAFAYEGWRQSMNQQVTTIVVECTAGMVMATAFGILQIIDRLVDGAGHSAGFEPLFGVMTAYPNTCTTVTTSDTATIAGGVSAENPKEDTEEDTKESIDKGVKASSKGTDPKKANAGAISKSSSSDNLKLIEGIGPKTSELLISNGITSFSKLASARVEVIKSILESGGSRFSLLVPDTWPQQAKLAADRKMDELKVLQDKLKGGK